MMNAFIPLADPRRVARALCLTGASLLCAAVPPHARSMPVMELRIDDMLSRAGELKKSLGLSPNQQTLWQQVETKARAILRARQVRRENLQADLQSGLGKANAQLRDLARRIDAESETSNAEDKQLRELWLGMNDALTDDQRQMAQAFLMEQLQRNAPGPREGMPERGPGMGGHRGGMGRPSGMQF